MDDATAKVVHKHTCKISKILIKKITTKEKSKIVVQHTLLIHVSLRYKIET